jgi:hypothetical protein
MTAGPAKTTAPIAVSNHPEPIIEVSDAQVAPISPISRRRPTSSGLVAAAVPDSDDIIDLFPDRAPEG